MTLPGPSARAALTAPTAFIAAELHAHKYRTSNTIMQACVIQHSLCLNKAHEIKGEGAGAPLKGARFSLLTHLPMKSPSLRSRYAAISTAS
jgi:hypothetical protein